MLKAQLSQVVAALVLAAAIGCGSDEKKPEPKASPKAAADATAKPRPKPKTTDDPDAAPQTTETQAIHIGPSKRKGDDTAVSKDDPQQQARIEELKRKAAESQGKDNGEPIRATGPEAPVPTGPKRTKASIKAEIASIEAELVSLDTERKSLVTKENSRRGQVEVSSDPERTKAIDQRMADLKVQRANDQAEVAAIEAKEADAPRGGAAGSDGSKGGAAGSDAPKGGAPGSDAPK